jgi:hypothetical protein
MGYVTPESYDQFFAQAVDNIQAFLNGRIPPGAINRGFWAAMRAPENLRMRKNHTSF